jgi:hypothetical protein
MQQAYVPRRRKAIDCANLLEVVDHLEVEDRLARPSFVQGGPAAAESTSPSMCYVLDSKLVIKLIMMFQPVFKCLPLSIIIER